MPWQPSSNAMKLLDTERKMLKLLGQEARALKNLAYDLSELKKCKDPANADVSLLNVKQRVRALIAERLGLKGKAQ